MLENLLIGQTSEPSDPYFENVTLLLHGDGTNGGQNNTFVDSSTNNFTITRNGNTTQGSFSPYGDLWSNYFDGSGDYLSTPSNTALSLGTGDFTIEFWWFKHGTSTNAPILDWRGSNTSSFLINNHNTANKIGLIWAPGTGYTEIVTITNAPTNTWCHIAFVRSGNNFSAYLDGVLASSGTGSYNSLGSSILIGKFYDSSTTVDAYISNLRIVKGTAVYTGAFTPPTAPLTAITNTSLLTCQSNRFRDASSNNFTITRNGDVSVQRFSPFSPSTAYSAATIGGSGYFDGTGDYLQTGTVSVSIGTGNFTIEMWVYPSQQDAVLFDARSGSTSNRPVISYVGSTFRFYSSMGDRIVSAANYPLNQWYHVAAVRNSGTTTLYVNGTSVGTYADTTDYGTATRFRIGAYDDGAIGAYLLGYLSNLRFGTSAVYTASFTPPTAPLTAITNTSLLLNFTNASIFDNAMMADLETVGNAQIDTAVKKYGTGSLEFDGTGDYLIAADNPNYNFGTGDYTIECWLYLSAINRVNGIWTNGPASSGSLGFYVTSGNKLEVAYYSGATLTGSTSLAASTWYHVAVSRSGTTTRIFLNGTQDATNTSSNNNTTQKCTVGNSFTSASDSLNGYIDDLRITKGVARYTANFTPPSAPFPNK